MVRTDGAHCRGCQCSLLDLGRPYRGSDEIIPYGVVDQLHNGIDSQFAHDRRAMRLDGFYADAENRSDLLITLGFGE